jgi:hypothetical protein
MIPAKVDPNVQATYLHQEMRPRLAEAQARRRAVFFVDAAHFVLAPFLGFLGLACAANHSHTKVDCCAKICYTQRRAPSTAHGALSRCSQ